MFDFSANSTLVRFCKSRTRLTIWKCLAKATSSGYLIDQECIVCQCTHPHPKSGPPTPDKAAPAAGRIVEISLVEHARELRGGNSDPCKERRALGVQPPSVRNERQGGRGETAEDDTGLGTEKQGCRADAGEDVVGFILGCTSKRVMDSRPAARRTWCA